MVVLVLILKMEVCCRRPLEYADRIYQEVPDVADTLKALLE